MHNLIVIRFENYIYMEEDNLYIYTPYCLITSAAIDVTLPNKVIPMASQSYVETENFSVNIALNIL